METVCKFNALKRLVKEGLDRTLSTNEIENLLSGITIKKRDYQKFVCEQADTYSRQSVARSIFAELLVLTWLPGQYSPIHDHAASNCGIRVLEGKLHENLYRAVPDVNGGAMMVASRVWQPGLVGSSSLETIHKVTNNEREERLVSLHLYSPPLSREEMKVYSEIINPGVIDRKLRPAA